MLKSIKQKIIKIERLSKAMLADKKVAVVVPAYNEEQQIGMVIETMPNFVDYIVIVNDASKDGTHDIVVEFINQKKYTAETDPQSLRHVAPNETLYNYADIVSQKIWEAQEAALPKHHSFVQEGICSKIVLIDNVENAKVGGAIAIGYSWCRLHGIDCTAVMAGDGQMDPNELKDICEPICEGLAEYVKGNRLSHKAAKEIIPKVRYFGNSVLSALTKIASGYWRLSDTQTGYTAISLSALEMIDLHKIYRSYGMPNDMLVKLNIEKCRVKEIPIKPIYNVGEKSKMNIGKVIFRVPGLLLKGFMYRILIKYFIRDFHPVFLFYISSMFNAFFSLYFLAYMLYGLIFSSVSTGTYFGFVLFFIMSVLSMGFAMWLDIYDNDKYQI